MVTEYEYNRKSQILHILRDIAYNICNENGEFRTGIGTLFFARNSIPARAHHCLTLPKASLLIQGNKEIAFAGSKVEVQTGQLLVTCVDIPSVSMITGISSQEPYLCIGFMLDKNILAELLAEIPPESLSQRHENINVWTLDPPLDFMETLLRIAQLIARPEQARILGPLLMRELHYLLLAGPHGAILHELYMHGTRDNNIIDAINWLKGNINSTISVAALAKKVNMSVSSLHRHFKTITGYSPLQYHKRLRLYEAQRRMFVDNERADIAALAVGYESITQFNREYKRMFGEPPKRDIQRRKNLAND